MKCIRTKKAMVLLLSTVLMLASLAGCTSGGSNGGGADVPDQPSAPLNVGTLMGPTGMGMAELITSEVPQLNVSIYDAPDQAMAGLLNGELDIAAIPSNVASVLYNKTEGGIRLLGVNTGGVLYVLSSGADPVSSLEDLKGKTVYASGMGGVPEYAFKALMAQAGMAESDVELVWMESHADVVSTLLTQDGYALVPEPQVTVAGTKSDSVQVCLDINELWKNAFGYELPMGVIVCRAEVADTRPDDVVFFLAKYYEGLEKFRSDIDHAAETISNAGILPSPGVAKAAISRCHIMLKTGLEEVKSILTPLYETLSSYNPKAVGGAIPRDDFYFSGSTPVDYSIELTY